MLGFVMALFTVLKRRIRKVLIPETVIHRGWKLPSKNLRFGGANFLDDEAFLAAGEADARKLQEWCGLGCESSVLDFGCGTGRLALGILSVFGDLHVYEGVDVSGTAIDWCRRNISSDHPSFRFTHTDVQNARYNPSGNAVGSNARLPFADRSFDVIHLYSVFSHLRSNDIRLYLGEFHRLLRKTGSVFLTAFVEENVPEEEENPAAYQQKWKGALHCVRYSLPFFTQLIAEADLRIVRHVHGTETDGQSAFVLQPR